MTADSARISLSSINSLSGDILEKYIIGVTNVHINEPAVNKKVRQLRFLATTIEKQNKIAWLLKAITCIDLTTLGSNDTATTVEKLCQKAVTPTILPFEWNEPFHTASVCVFPARIKDAVKALEDNKQVFIASVAGGFPSGQYPLSSRLEEIRFAIENGANEIDVVIDRSLVLAHKWKELYEDLLAIRKACQTATMKTILATGELCSLSNVYKSSMIAMLAGSDFIKTSTGKETVNATLPVGIIMCRAIKDFYRMTNKKVGFKPAGGIKTATDALEWMVLIKEELGNSWLNKDLFRIGASSLLDDVVNTITSTYESVATNTSQPQTAV